MKGKENPIRKLRLEKVTVNMGVGEGGDRLAKAEALLETLTQQKPIRTYAKRTNATFGIRKGAPIACKVTLRKERAEAFLSQALASAENRLKLSHFDREGNLSFGVKEHIDLPGVKYDPSVGIFGMDVSLTFERPGYRIKRRRNRSKKIPKVHRVTREEAVAFMKETYQVAVGE
jgi:large subunit ribosomal protein L5